MNIPYDDFNVNVNYYLMIINAFESLHTFQSLSLKITFQSVIFVRYIIFVLLNMYKTKTLTLMNVV